MLFVNYYFIASICYGSPSIYIYIYIYGKSDSYNLRTREHFLDIILKIGKSDENKEDDVFEERHSLPEHPLRHQKALEPYKCNDCKQPGFTSCFKCPKDICYFYLHEDCFQAKHSPYKTHKFTEKCKFYYHASPPCMADKYCNACGLDILGFRYECSTHDENPHYLHPTCANIDFEMDWDGLKLELRDKVESKCLHCDQRYPAEEFTGWKWVSEERYYGFPFCSSGRKICFHVKCMKEIMAPKEKEV